MQHNEDRFIPMFPELSRKLPYSVLPIYLYYEYRLLISVCSVVQSEILPPRLYLYEIHTTIIHICRLITYYNQKVRLKEENYDSRYFGAKFSHG